ncbi:methyltransferase-like protein 27 isoform X1 [Rhinatrema bivittatum]|uniref:methyltransferase-like protein 27 isoform X1 n=1 Tax=Rhinatrema bivittatum TaxID=194408 RepID=UPI00112B1690|nr:methyltransferase-like protein 27 isoform X1 [Rhinatrema bivittatum]
MAVPRRSLAEVQELISSAHEDNTVAEKLQFYDCWALEYEHDVEVLEYRAPRLAAECLASAFPADRDSQIILDVACGTGLVAVELYRHGFRIFHGMDGSEQMLQHARQKKLYQELKQSILGQEPLAAPTDLYDAVIIVGAMSCGQVPLSVIPELCRVTKPAHYPHTGFADFCSCFIKCLHSSFQTLHPELQRPSRERHLQPCDVPAGSALCSTNRCYSIWQPSCLSTITCTNAFTLFQSQSPSCLLMLKL